MEIPAKVIRELAIEVLDTEGGITLEAWDILASLLCNSGNKDIYVAIQTTEEQFYLGEDDAEDLRNARVEEVETEEVE